MEPTAALLDDLAVWIRRFVVVTPDQATAIALWVAHTYVYECGDTSPYLIVSSAERRSGKTRVIECIQPLLRDEVTTSSMTEAALFRAIHQWKPTLLIDETDAFFKNGKRDPSERQEAIRAILNSGYRRGSYAIRCENVGGKQSVERFGIYCPKLLAGIGHLPDTIRDRGIPIRLQRRTREEVIERYRFKIGAREGPVLAERLRMWAEFNDVSLGQAEPAMPDELDDRAQDAYEILIAIAELAGEEWRTRAIAALVALRNEDLAPVQSTGSQLMDDLFTVIPYLQGKHVATPDLLALVYEHGENPWEEWWGEASGKRAAMRLSKGLREYDLAPAKFRVGTATRRGYEVEALGALIGRYASFGSEQRNIPANGDKKVGTEEEPCSDVESGDLQEGSDRSDLFGRGTPDWIATASAADLAEWKREVLDS